jgi:hypothetical protein
MCTFPVLPCKVSQSKQVRRKRAPCTSNDSQDPNKHRSHDITHPSGLRSLCTIEPMLLPSSPHPQLRTQGGLTFPTVTARNLAKDATSRCPEELVHLISWNGGLYCGRQPWARWKARSYAAQARWSSLLLILDILPTQAASAPSRYLGRAEGVSYMGLCVACCHPILRNRFLPKQWKRFGIAMGPTDVQLQTLKRTRLGSHGLRQGDKSQTLTLLKV